MHIRSLFSALFLAALLASCTKKPAPDAAKESSAEPRQELSKESKTDTAKLVAPPTPVAATTAASSAQTKAPDFDVGPLTRKLFKSDKGTRLLLLRDKRVEIRHASGSPIETGTYPPVEGNKLALKMDDGSARSLTIAEGGKSLILDDGKEVFAEQVPLTPDGKTYTSNSGGIVVKFTGNKVLFQKPGSKRPLTGTNVKYNADTVTYTDSESDAEFDVEHTLAIYNGGVVLIDVTPAQVANAYVLKDLEK